MTRVIRNEIDGPQEGRKKSNFRGGGQILDKIGHIIDPSSGKKLSSPVPPSNSFVFVSDPLGTF